MTASLRRALRVLPIVLLVSCAPPAPQTPRPTAPTLLDVIPAPTQDIDATATVYALRLVPSPTPTGLYVVQRNDTLSGIAEAFGTTVEELMAANGLTDPNALQVGQSLLIPALISGTLPLGTPSLPAATAAITATRAPADLSRTPTLSTP